MAYVPGESVSQAVTTDGDYLASFPGVSTTATAPASTKVQKQFAGVEEKSTQKFRLQCLIFQNFKFVIKMIQIASKIYFFVKFSFKSCRVSQFEVGVKSNQRISSHNQFCRCKACRTANADKTTIIVPAGSLTGRRQI